MLTQLTRNWWAVALRGAVAILYGVLALVWPRLTIEILVLFFGAYMFVDGIFAIIAAFTNRTGMTVGGYFYWKGWRALQLGLLPI